MVQSKMFVPEKIKIGYQNREGTYTGKLAYVIYYDNKGKLRKETSWESWRDKKIDPVEFTNTPISGFVLNKGVGGGRASYGWDARNEYIRVWDPRDFEFEISVANLLFILQETSAIKGKGLEGEFVYAWDGTELVLLPVGCTEHKLCTEHTQRQDKKVIAKDVKPGFSYVMKNGTNVMYLGKFPYNNLAYYKEAGFEPCGTKHVFFNLDDPTPDYGCPYIIDTGFTKLAEVVSSGALVQYPDDLDKFKASKYYGLVVDISIEDCEAPSITEWRATSCIVKSGDGFKMMHIKGNWRWSSNHDTYTVRESKEFKPQLKDSAVKFPSLGDYRNMDCLEFGKLVFQNLSVVNGGGVKIRVI
jgi:hypothetical protein